MSSNGPGIESEIGLGAARSDVLDKAAIESTKKTRFSIWRWFAWLFPTRTDWLVGLFLLVITIDLIGEATNNFAIQSYFPMSFAPFSLAILLGIATGWGILVGFKRDTASNRRILVAGFLVSLLVIVLLTHPLSVSNADPFGNQGRTAFFFATPLTRVAVALLGSVLMFGGGWLVAMASRWSAELHNNWWEKRQAKKAAQRAAREAELESERASDGEFEFDDDAERPQGQQSSAWSRLGPRTKFLIQAAAVLFVLRMAQVTLLVGDDGNFVDGLWIDRVFKNLGWGRRGSVASLIVLFPMFVAAAIAIPWMIVRQSSMVYRILGIIGFVLLSLGTYIWCVATGGVVGDAAAIVLMFLLFEFAMLITLSCCISAPQTVGVALPRQRGRRVSIWTVLPLAATIAIGIIGLRYDVFTLLGTRFQGWSEARANRQLFLDSNRQVCVLAFGVWRNTLQCEFDESTSPQVFRLLGNASVPAFISISGMHPNVDTSYLPAGGAIYVFNSTISAQQLVDLSGSATSLMLAGVKAAEGQANQAQLKPATSLTISGSYSEEQKSGMPDLLEMIADPGAGSSLNVNLGYGPLGNEQELKATVDQLARLSEYTDIQLPDRVFFKVLTGELQPTYPLNRVWGNPFFRLPNGDPDELDLSIVRQVLESPLRVQLTTAPNSEILWDLAFAKRQDAIVDFWEAMDAIAGVAQPKGELHALFSHHFVFDTNENGKATGIFLPNGEALLGRMATNQFAELSELTTISFSPQWLRNFDGERTDYELGILSPRFNQSAIMFRAFKKLRRLEFDLTSPVVDFNLLANVPNIEELQIRFEENDKAAVKFAQCQQLKRLVFFGLPAPRNLSDWQALPNLESVTLVLEASPFNDSVAEADLLEEVKAALGDRVNVVQITDFVSEPPAEFRAHVERVTDAVKKKYGATK